MQDAQIRRNEAHSFTCAAVTKDAAQRRRWTFDEAVMLLQFHPDTHHPHLVFVVKGVKVGIAVLYKIAQLKQEPGLNAVIKAELPLEQGVIPLFGISIIILSNSVLFNTRRK